MSTLTPKLHLNLVEDADNANTAVRVLHNQDVTILDEAVLLTAAQTLTQKTLASPTVTGRLGVNVAAGSTGTINGTPLGDAVPLHVKSPASGSSYIAVEHPGAGGLWINDTSRPIDGRLWGFETNGGLFRLMTYTDSGLSTTRFSVDRSGNVVVTGTLTTGNVSVAGNLVITGTSSVTGATTGNLISWTNTDPGALGVQLTTLHDSASPAGNDAPFALNVAGRSSTGVQRTYGALLHIIINPTNAAETSEWLLQTMQAGALATALIVTGGAGGVANALTGSLTIAGNSVALVGAPAAWGGAYRSVTVLNEGMLACSDANLILSRNLYNDGAAWRLKTADAGESIQMTGGTFYFQTATTGSVGAVAPGLATRAQLDTSGLTLAGRLVIGTSTFLAGSLYKDATSGVILAGTTGSAYDVSLANAAGAGVLGVLAGTTTTLFTGHVAVAPATAVQAISAGFTSLFLGGIGSLMSSTVAGDHNSLNILNNLYLTTGGWKFIATGPAPGSLYQQLDGRHIFFNTVAGTPGGGFAALVQRMEITASGGVVVTNGLSSSAGGIANTVAAAGSTAYVQSVSGDAQGRLLIVGNGTINWGSGAVAVDTNLYRFAAGALKTDGDFYPNRLFVGGSGHNARAFRGVIAAGAQVNLTAGPEGGLVVINNDSGLYTGLFLLSGWSTQVVELSDPANQFAASGVANMICIYWDGGVGNFVVSNRYASAQTVDWWLIA